MLKKIISLGLSITTLIKMGGIDVFAQQSLYNEKKNSESSYYDYCRGYPKNSFNKTADVDCAIESIFPKFKSDKKKLSISLSQIGETGEIDVHMWKYNGLMGLASDFEGWIKGANKKYVKGQFTEKFIKETNKLFNLNSEKDAVEIIDRWIKMSNYSKPFLDSIREDLSSWAKKLQTYEGEVSGDFTASAAGGSIGAVIGAAGGAGIGGLASAGTVAGAGVAVGMTETAPLIVGAVEGAVAGSGVVAGGTVAGGATAGGGVVAAVGATAVLMPCIILGAVVIGGCGAYYGYRYSKVQKMNRKAHEALKKAEKQKRKWDIYSKALENILMAIENDEWIDNDLLRAELNYEKELPYARTNFIKVGIDIPKNVTMLFKNLSRELAKLKENLLSSRESHKNDKEEL